VIVYIVEIGYLVRVVKMKPVTFKFSEPYVKVQYIEDVSDYKIDGRTILFNVDEKSEILIEGKSLKPGRSSIFKNVVVPSARRFVSITVEPDFLSQNSYKYASEIKKKWSHVYDIFPLPHLKGTRLWRSEKEKINDVAFNLWFADAGTDCGIHNEHDFREIHAQIFGIGRMQKFHKNDKASIYQEVFMIPGYTHEIFYDENSQLYPWHQYYADTDCIWLAAEYPLLTTSKLKK
jgi:hypothetical protein